MNDRTNTEQLLDAKRVAVPDTSNLQQRIILQAQQTPQQTQVLFNTTVLKRLSSMFQHRVVLPVGGFAVAMTVAVMFLSGDVLLPHNKLQTLSTNNMVVLVSNESGIEAEIETEQLDWDTYFMLETEMVFANL